MISVTVKKNLKPLKDLERRARELDGHSNVSIPELLTPEFMTGCSRFTSAQELFDSSGFKIDSPDDFKAIPDVEWNAFISSNTSYANWEEMLSAVIGERLKRQLGL